MFARCSKTFKSGEPAHSTPTLLVQQMLNDLAQKQDYGWVTFESKTPAHFVEVALENDALVLNLDYCFKEDYRELFSRHEIEIPDGWTVTEFKPKGWLHNGTLLLTTNTSDQSRVVAFISMLFLRLYHVPANGLLSGTFQG